MDHIINKNLKNTMKSMKIPTSEHGRRYLQNTQTYPENKFIYLFLSWIYAKVGVRTKKKKIQQKVSGGSVG